MRVFKKRVSTSSFESIISINNKGGFVINPQTDEKFFVSQVYLKGALDGDKVKVGMITTLSGGGSGLGIDIRDGFALAVKDEPNIEIISGDDQRKPDIAVQLADKMIQSDKVDIITGIVWSNLAMAVVPAVVNQGKFYLSPNAGPSLLAGKKCHKNYFNVAWQNDNLHEAAGGYANSAGFKNSFILACEASAC